MERLGAWSIVLSSNVELRRDGLPYASRPEPKDPGVAVYFNLGLGRNRKPHVLACDRWLTVRDERKTCLKRAGFSLVIKAAYRRLALAHHPDDGGTSDHMTELNRAYEEAQQLRR